MNASKEIPTIINIEKFLSSILINNSSECWEWVGHIDKGGYGIFNEQKSGKRKTLRAHRVSFCIFNRQLIPGLVIDHVCRNRKCVNPEHLKEVTIAENVTENSFNPLLKKRYSTHCKNGHEFIGENVEIIKNGRRCRPCYLNALKKHYQKRKIKNK